MSEPEPEQSEELVAYLDGELNDEAATQVEETLVKDADVRKDVEQMTRAYELLDLLPSARASEHFTEKTLSAITARPKLVNSPEAETEYLPELGRRVRVSSPRWVVRIVGLAGLLIVATIGFNRTSQRDAEPIVELLTEFPLIERLDQYQAAGDVEFLEQLASSGLFDEQPE